MKVKFTAEAKKYITVAEMPHVRRIINEMREDDSLEEYAQMAARLVLLAISCGNMILSAPKRECSGCWRKKF